MADEICAPQAEVSDEAVNSLLSNIITVDEFCEPQAEVFDEAVNSLLSDKDLRFLLQTTFGLVGHDSFVSLGNSKAAVYAHSLMRIKEGVGIIRKNAWERFVSEYTMNGNSYALKVSPEHLPVSLNDATLLLISETLYNTMPASESYKYVGDQWETRLILMRVFAA